MIHPKWTTTDPHKRLARLIRMWALALINVVVLLVVGLVLSIASQSGLSNAEPGSVTAVINQVALVGGFFLIGLSAAVLYLVVVIAHEIKQGQDYLAGHQ